VPGSLCTCEGKTLVVFMGEQGGGCPGCDRWKAQGVFLPGAAWRSWYHPLGVVPREGWAPHPHSASAGLLGSLACREGPQSRQEKKVLSYVVMMHTQTLWEKFPHSCGPAPSGHNTAIIFQPLFFPLLLGMKPRAFYILDEYSTSEHPQAKPFFLKQ
jgi:hypothetical protein